MASMNGYQLPHMTNSRPSMTPAKKRPSRVLDELARRRRAQRKALGIDDIRDATSAQIKQARVAGALPTSAILELQRRRAQAHVNHDAAAGDIHGIPGKVPPGTPHAVQQAMLLGPQFLNVSGRKRKNKGPVTGRAF